MKNLILKTDLHKTFKTIIGVFLFFGMTQCLNAQDGWVGEGTGQMQTENAGDKVGIGKTPTYHVDVAGDVRANWHRINGAKGLYAQSYGTFFQAINSNYWRMRSNRGMEVRTKGNKRMGVLYHNTQNGFGLLDGDGNWVIRSERDSYISFAINNNEKMRVLTDGRVLVGATTAPTMSTAFSDPYLFYVNGGGLFKEVKVEAGWADYVFDAEYSLTPLTEVENHIETYGHLHNTPSEAELAAKGGIELGNITVNQQEKIEEIFLHLIELNKEIESLKKENEALKAGMKH